MLAAMKNNIVVAPLTRESVVEVQVVAQISEAQWLVEFHTTVSEIKLTKLGSGAPKNALMSDFLSKRRPGLLLFSSGSTGVPKGILLDLSSILLKYKAERPRLTAISFLLLDHFGGINTMFHILSGLGTLVTLQDRSVREICQAIERHRVELLPTTPSFLNLLVHSDAASKYDLSSLKIISYGTEVMSQVTLDRLRALFPDIRIHQTYGLSELGVVRSQSRGDGSLWIKIGGDGFQTKIIDDVLWIKSDYAMVGYLNAPSPFDKDGWFNTQDRVQVDGDWLKILGRITDVINVGGQKIYPAEVEDVIISLQNVDDVRVYGEPHPLLGNIVVAEVRLRSPEDQDQLKKRVRKACADSLTNFKVPSKVLIAQSEFYSSRQKKLRGSIGQGTAH
jgi:acyl-CoA synthetase (AMP-forming)/AMP-acid ligase II